MEERAPDDAMHTCKWTLGHVALSRYVVLSRVIEIRLTDYVPGRNFLRAGFPLS